MSDCVDWHAVCIWAAAVGFQVGTAIYNAWKQPKSRSPIETGYEKVQRGETVHGWEMVISPARIQEMHNRSYAAAIMPSWRNDDTEFHSAFRHDLSMLVRFHQDAPDGRNVYVLRRYSLIADIDTMIARIIYNEQQWWYRCTCYLTSRTVAVVFPHISHYQCRLVLLDLPSKRHQVITIQSPFEVAVYPIIVTVRRRDLSKNQLSVLYRSQVHTDDGERRWEFCDTIYDIPTSEIGLNVVIEATSSRMISIPHNEELVAWSRPSGFPPVVVLYNNETPEAVERHLVVSFDQPGNWQITTLADWLAAFRSTSIGSRFMNAVDAFGSLSPPESIIWCNIPQLLYVGSRYEDYVCGYENGNAAYANIRFEGGVMRRWINPPSLKHLAAAALCRANPNLNTAELGGRIGCDIFDGMRDKSDGDDDHPVIYV